MTTMNLKLAQTLFPMLTLALLAAGCSDSTGPSKGGDSIGDSPVQLPVDNSGTPLGRDLVPDHEPTDPPAPPQLGDTANSAMKPVLYTPSLFTKSAPLSYGYAPGPGATNVFPGAVGCLGGLISLSQSGITVSRTSGLSAAYNQHAVGEVFLYRLVGNTFVYQDWRRADAPLPWVAPLAQLKQNDPLLASIPGGYRVIVRVTWYASIGGVWARAASININFFHASDYRAVLGATVSSGGYCRVS
jgi:hypothetical protein